MENKISACESKYYPAQTKKFKEIVFFVHFYLGSKTLLKRHIDLVNDLGFDAFAFNLIDEQEFFFNPLSKKKLFGIKHIWADQIEELLNTLPGKKIIFAFSNPSASAIEAMYYRNCNDVKALICDSGPSGKFLASAFNLFRYYKEKSHFKRFLRVLLTPFLWSQFFHKDLKLHLTTFPKGFPILSIRGWKDTLIPPDHIDCVFEGHPQLSWKKLSLPKAGHLNGLKDFKDTYTQGLIPFLNEVGSLLL